MLTLLVASAFAMKFPGGLPNAFVADLSRATRQNVLLCQSETQNVAKVAFENADLTEMARAIRNQAGHAILPGSEMILSDQMLARKLVTGGGFVRPPKSSVFAPSFEGNQYPPKIVAVPVNFIRLPKAAVTQGLVTYKTADAEALQLKLLDGPFSKPVTFHWIYGDAPIYLQASGLPELDFLKWIAKAAGARLIASGKTYDFQLDPAAIRARAIATLRALAAPYKNAKGYEHDRETYTFRIDCLNALTSEQIAEALETPYSTVKVQLHPGTALYAAVGRRIRELEAYQKTFGENSRAHKYAIGLLPKVDPDRPAYLIVDAKFYARLQIPVLDERGQPAGIVDMTG